ncbi:MAG: LysM peptidoglycan-binding domain-containing protein [Thermoguttaceae bacterium]
MKSLRQTFALVVIALAAYGVYTFIFLKKPVDNTIPDELVQELAQEGISINSTTGVDGKSALFDNLLGAPPITANSVPASSSVPTVISGLSPISSQSVAPAPPFAQSVELEDAPLFNKTSVPSHLPNPGLFHDSSPHIQPPPLPIDFPEDFPSDFSGDMPSELPLPPPAESLPESGPDLSRQGTMPQSVQEPVSTLSQQPVDSDDVGTGVAATTETLTATAVSSALDSADPFTSPSSGPSEYNNLSDPFFGPTASETSLRPADIPAQHPVFSETVQQAGNGTTSVPATTAFVQPLPVVEETQATLPTSKSPVSDESSLVSKESVVIPLPSIAEPTESFTSSVVQPLPDNWSTTSASSSVLSSQTPQRTTSGTQTATVSENTQVSNTQSFSDPSSINRSAVSNPTNLTHFPDQVGQANSQLQTNQLIQPPSLSQINPVGQPNQSSSDNQNNSSGSIVPTSPLGISAISAQPVQQPVLEQGVRPEFMQSLAEIRHILNNGDYREGHRRITELYHQELSPVERKYLLPTLDKCGWAAFFSRSYFPLNPAYKVGPNDTLESIAASFQVTPELIRKINGLSPDTTLQPGQELKIPRGPFYASISLSQHELVLYSEGLYACRFRIGIGEPGMIRETMYRIEDKFKNPRYIGENGEVESGDPANPLGTRWIGLDGPLGIHGTNDTRWIGNNQSPVEGFCLDNKDVEEIYDMLVAPSTITIRR